MPLNEQYPQAVVFIVGDRPSPLGQPETTPIGTGFIVRVPAEDNGDSSAHYVVTAAHCVQAEFKTWVRVPTDETSVEDLRITEWVSHPSEDVAVARFVATSKMWRSIPISAIDNPQGRSPTLGDRVYFLGLLRGIGAMASRNIPIVLSGTIGALNQQGIPITTGIGPDRLD